MRAIRKVRREPGLVIEEVDTPVVQPDEVLVKVEAASVCGTDLHVRDERAKTDFLTSPAVRAALIRMNQSIDPERDERATPTALAEQPVSGILPRADESGPSSAATTRTWSNPSM